MMQTLEIVHPIDGLTEDAAATTMQRTGERLNASLEDIDLVLAILFAELLS